MWSVNYLHKRPIATSMDSSIPRIGRTFSNCQGTLLSNELLSLWPVWFCGAEACIWKSGVTRPVSVMQILQQIVKISPGLFLFISCKDWHPAGVPINRTVSGYFVQKCWNVLCLLLCQSAYCTSPIKNGCSAFSFSTLWIKFLSSCSARGSVTSTDSLFKTGMLSSSGLISLGWNSNHKFTCNRFCHDSPGYSVLLTGWDEN